MPETYTSGMWRAKAGEEDDFVAAWREFAEWARTMPGCGTLRLVRDVEQPSRFMSFAPWESFEAQREWKELGEFPERMTRVRRHVDEFAPSTYELVLQVGQRLTYKRAPRPQSGRLQGVRATGIRVSARVAGAFRDVRALKSIPVLRIK